MRKRRTYCFRRWRARNGGESVSHQWRLFTFYQNHVLSAGLLVCSFHLFYKKKPVCKWFVKVFLPLIISLLDYSQLLQLCSQLIICIWILWFALIDGLLRKLCIALRRSAVVPNKFLSKLIHTQSSSNVHLRDKLHWFFYPNADLHLTASLPQLIIIEQAYFKWLTYFYKCFTSKFSWNK